MRKFVVTLFSLLAFWGQMGAEAIREIRSVETTVEVNKDGSAWVTQVWDVEAGSSGTEFYMPVSNLGEMTISRLSVTENGQTFESLGEDWDVDRSRRWKTGKSGIVLKRDGVELCWGLGEEGPHVWTVRYLLTGLVQAYDDADAFNYMFVNRGLDPAPQRATVTIKPAFACEEWTPENTRVWAFGFYGEIYVENGTVAVRTTESMGRNSAIIALVAFDQDMFTPDVTAGGPVQDLIDRALDGSSYGEDSDDDSFLMRIFGIGFIIAFLFSIFTAVYAGVATARGYKWKKSLFGQKKITGWFRDVPLEGNLHAAQYLLTKGKRFGASNPANNLIGAFFLRWIMNGSILVQPDPKSEKRVTLLFKAEDVSDDDVENDLYSMAREAAGSNQLLERGEFEKWSRKNYKKLTAWPDRSIARGKSWFHNKLYFVTDETCTAEGAAEARHLVEFQNFLSDFTLSDQRGASEVSLWKEYLVYAQLFGIADKVAAQFKKLYPAEFAQVANETGLDSTTFIYMMNWTNNISTHSFNNAVSRAGSVSGGGGGASFGGGGGFSGGGFGGGGR